MDLEMIKDFIQPELLILIPVLYSMGIAIRKAKRIKNNYIPSILGLTGIILAGLWCISKATQFDGQTIVACMFAAITQGVLCAAGSVFVDQIIKQTKNDK